MKDFFRELYDYNHATNVGFIGLFNKEATLQTNGELLKLMSHIVNAQEIWNCRILGNFTGRGVWDIQETAYLPLMEEACFSESLRIIEETDLSRDITYTNSRGQQYSNSARDILFHVINHSTHHRAQISTGLRLLGLTPPISDYIFHKR